MSEPIEDLQNIGPTIARRLREVGVATRRDLHSVGAAGTYRMLRERFPAERLSVCYYLYSLEGALRGCHWDAIGERVKARLRAEIGHDQERD